MKKKLTVVVSLIMFCAAVVFPIAALAQTYGTTCDSKDSDSSSCKNQGPWNNKTCTGSCHTVTYSPTCGNCGWQELGWCTIVATYTSVPYTQDGPCAAQNVGGFSNCGCPASMPPGTYGAPVDCTCNP